MLEIFISAIEISVVCLVLILVSKMLSLSTQPEQNEVIALKRKNLKERCFEIINSPPPSVDYHLKETGLRKAQIFIGLQLFEVKRLFGVRAGEGSEWQKKACALYLASAVEEIAREVGCCSRLTKELVTLVLKSNLKLSPSSIDGFLEDNLIAEDERNYSIMKEAGDEAAKNWLSKQKIPDQITLAKQLADHGFA